MQKVRLDFADPTYIPTLWAMQGDIYSRFVAISLYYDGAPYEIAEGSTFKVNYKLRGGLEGAYDTISTSDSSSRPACTFSGNIITMEIAEILTVDGNSGKISIEIVGSDSSKLHTWEMPYLCGALPSAISSNPSIDGVLELITKAVADVNTGKENILNAAVRAEMAARRAEASEPAGAAERAESARDEAVANATVASQNLSLVKQLTESAIAAKEESIAQASSAYSSRESAENSAARAEQAAATVQPETISAIVTPPGTIIWFAGSVPPSNYLVCNGSAISRSVYASLFGVIGTIYGSGDGSTTFNVPDLRDRVAWGGTSVGIIKKAGLPDLTGLVKSTSTESCGSEGSYRSPIGSIDRQNASAINSIYGASNTVQPPALTLMPCIKY